MLQLVISLVLKLFDKKKNLEHEYSDYVRQDDYAEMYHFIGKDIMYFHSVFWPAVLMGSKHRLQPIFLYMVSSL